MEYTSPGPFGALARALKLYALYLRLYFKRLGVYRADTAITLVTGLLTQAGSIVFIEILYRITPNLAGWGKYQLLFLYGVMILGRSLSEIFLNVPYHIGGLVRTGQLDVLMIRPTGALFQAIGVSQEINGMGSAVTALAVMVYAGFKIQLSLGAGQVVFLAVAVVCNTLVYYDILMFLAILSFWVVEVRNIMMPTAWLYEFTRYPVSLFHPVVQALLTFVTPYALGTFFPVCLVLGIGSCAWIVWVLPVYAAVFTAGVYVYWRYAMNRYTSAAG